MQYYDLLIVAFLVVGFVYGFTRGLITMLFSLLAVIVGLLGGVFVARLIASWFPESYRQVWFWIVFVVVFTGGYFGIKRLSYWLEDMLEFLELEWLDAFLGGVLGLLQFGFIVGLVFILFTRIPFLPYEWIRKELPFGVLLGEWTQGVIAFFMRLG